MSIFFVESYVVGPEEMERLSALLGRASNLMKEKPEKFPGLRSYRAFSRMIGEFGAHTEIWEFENMNNIEALYQAMFTDEELKQIPKEFFTLIEPGTYSTEIWSTVTEHTMRR